MYKDTISYSLNPYLYGENMRKTAKAIGKASAASPGIYGLYRIACLPTVNVAALAAFLVVILLIVACIFKWLRKDIQSLLSTIFSGKSKVESAKQGKEKSPSMNDRPNAESSERDS